MNRIPLEAIRGLFLAFSITQGLPFLDQETQEAIPFSL
jgi:hypothetical protein